MRTSLKGGRNLNMPSQVDAAESHAERCLECRFVQLRNSPQIPRDSRTKTFHFKGKEEKKGGEGEEEVLRAAVAMDLKRHFPGAMSAPENRNSSW